MIRPRVAVEVKEPLLRDVLEHELSAAGMEVVGNFSDPFTLLCSIERLDPEVVFLWTSDAFREPGICSHLLGEFPKLVVVSISPDKYTISDVHPRTQTYAEPSIDSVCTSLLQVLGR